MARDQFSIHISRKAGIGTSWGVDTVRFRSDVGRHSVYPEGRRIGDVLVGPFADALLEAVETLDQDRRFLNRPDFGLSVNGVGLQGLFCHLDRSGDGLLTVTVRVREVLGTATRLLVDRSLDLEAAPAARLPDAEIAALTALERVLLPLMNATEALEHKVSQMPVDLRLTILLSQVRDGGAELGALARALLRHASESAPAAEAARSLPPGAAAQDPGARRVLPALLQAMRREDRAAEETQRSG